MPHPGSLPDRRVNPSPRKWRGAGVRKALDITSLITGDGAYSLRITAASTDGGDYYSKEGGYAPQLVATAGQAGGMRGLELSKARRKSGLAKIMATKQDQAGLMLV